MYRAGCVLVLLAGSPPAASAQGRLLDSGTLLVSRGGVPIGREEFTVQQGNSVAPGGFTISVRSYYPPSRAQPSVAPVLELGADSQPTSTHMVEFGAEQRRVFVQVDDRRVTVRTMSSAGESVRQYPGSERLVIADASALSLYAVPPSAAGLVGEIWPREYRHGVSPLVDLGVEAATVQGRNLRLRHLVLGSGEGARHLWYDDRGRLMKVDVPGTNLTAVRGPGQ